MKKVRFAIIGLAVVSLAAACKSEQPVSPYAQGPAAQPAQVAAPAQAPQPAAQPANPMAGLAALGQVMGQAAAQAGQPAAGQQAAPGAPAVVSPTALVPWQSLAQALPTAAPGWTLQGQVEGESVNVMGIAASTAKCHLVQGAMTAEVDIVDNAMSASMAAMGFAMVGNMSADTNEARSSRVNFGTYPGMQTYQKQSNNADVTVVVGNRLLITVKVTNAGGEAPALQLAQAVNFALLASLLGT